MTERLYYTDSYCREFDARVTRTADRDGRRVVVLDRTFFYPTSGGQPFDTGQLGSSRVVDVIDLDDGTIGHVIGAADESGTSSGDAPDWEPGRSVHGTIDWSRRFDHMQQHTAQHVLSAAIERLFGVATVSFHLGSSSSTIDLARELTREEIAAAEAEANQVVWQDRPVSIRYASAEEAAALPLRKESRRDGTLRLIDVEGFDLSACGGTHVARTGAIGLIAIGSWERFKGGQRLEFYCGSRALARFSVLRESVASAVRLLSVLPGEIGGGIERLQVEAKERERALSALREELARYQVDELAAAAEVAQVGRVVLRSLEGDAVTLKRLAAGLVDRPGHVAVLVSSASPALVVAARSAGVAVSANQLIARLTSEFGGRGGGKPEFAQAGGLDAPPETIVKAAREFLMSSHQ